MAIYMGPPLLGVIERVMAVQDVEKTDVYVLVEAGPVGRHHEGPCAVVLEDVLACDPGCPSRV